MSFLETLTEKPWMSNRGPMDRRPSERDNAAEARRIALRFFLGVVAILFSLMVVAYAGRMSYVDWRPAPQIRLLWANTTVLILASVFMQWALHCARKGKLDYVRTGLLAAGVFTLVFLFGQVVAWRQLAEMVLGDFKNPAVGFFYMITGVHGVHMLGGMVAWARTAMKAWGAHRGDTVMLKNSIGNCALYWHFLLGVWLVVFGLLFSGDNFELLLKICGIR
jgi:cytochrome c oxidase subunit III